MDIRELSVGNLVYLWNKSFEVVGINPPYVDLGYGGRLRMCEVDEEVLEPIPITEELLLKCGFDEPCDDVYEHKDNEFEVTKENDKWWVSWNGGADYWFDIKHIHQLQNAYQLVIGKELEINL